MAFASYGIRRCSWDFLGANTDQGLFWYVFAVLRHSAARSRVKTYAVKVRIISCAPYTPESEPESTLTLTRTRT